MDTAARRVWRGKEEISLTAKEYAILEYLLRNAGSVLTRSQIQEHAWDFSYEGASNMIDVYVNSLRRKLDSGDGPRLIRTVRGVGYTLRADEESGGGKERK
jgi:DNA-binding response OmpR family regulator